MLVARIPAGQWRCPLQAFSAANAANWSGRMAAITEPSLPVLSCACLQAGDRFATRYVFGNPCLYHRSRRRRQSIILTFSSVISLRERKDHHLKNRAAASEQPPFCWPLS
jgi:hypothetical protein